ncbi:HAMP domain-containing protein [Aneurinibacillus tyrosinisolvens]|uniref:HAMP domain-containing protein n=1 Tax=Aneurinibacillus tyrosinisolvens TaxID=1443435 RepID=UPI00069A6D23|nr:cache domain-containing protein [Aneurinibacillus tyrosinisolvens]
MRNVLNLTVRSRLIIAFVVILLIPSLTIGWTSYQTAKDTVDKQMTISANETVKLLNSNLDSFFKSEIQSIDYLADRITADTYKSRNPILKTNILKPFLSKNPEMLEVYVGSTDGLFIDAPIDKVPDGYDPRQRAWYQEAMNRKSEVIITSPYVSKTTGNVVVTIAKVIKDSSGVLGFDVNLNAIATITNQVKIGQDGYAFIQDKNRKVVVHPTVKPGEVMNSDATEKIYQSESGDFDYLLNGKAKAMVFTTNKLTGWKVGGTFYSDEVSKEAQPIFYKTVLVLFIALLVGAVIVYFIVNSITKPLKSLVHASEKIGQGDLTEVIQVKSNDELGQLGNSFNQMATNFAK